MVPEPEIVCVDCGGRCFLLGFTPEDGGWRPGDIVAYRCEDCRDRWDLVLPGDPDDPDADAEAGAPAGGPSWPDRPDV